MQINRDITLRVSQTSGSVEKKSEISNHKISEQLRQIIIQDKLEISKDGKKCQIRTRIKV